MDVTGLPFLAPIQRLMLHLFTDFVVSAILIGNEYGVVHFDELLDKVCDCATFSILNKLCDHLSATCDGS